jgi:hypothetical protein
MGTPFTIVEHEGHEVDITVDCVCDTCNHGWMRKLEGSVSAFLKPMFDGQPTVLTKSQRFTLARWAAKTAMVFECSYEHSPRTPREVAALVRQSIIPPATEVQIGKYDGGRVLDHFRAIWVAKATAHEQEPHHHFFTTLLIGQVVIHVFADPWADWRPTLTAQAAENYIALVGGPAGPVHWPPPAPVDENLFQVITRGPNSEMRAGFHDFPL